MANYLLDYRGFKAIFEAANEEVDSMIAAAKASDEGTEVPQKPAYEPLFTWFADHAVKGSSYDQNNSDAVKKSIQYWTGDADKQGSSTLLDGAINTLEFFTDPEKTTVWFAALATASGRQGNTIDAKGLAKNAKSLLDKLKSVKAEGWVLDNTYPNNKTWRLEYLNPDKNVDKEKLLQYVPFGKGVSLEYTKPRQYEDGFAEGVYTKFKAWADNLDSNLSTMTGDLEKPIDKIFKRAAVPMKTEDKVAALDILQTKAEKYVNGKNAKYDNASDAIQNAYSIKISPKSNGVTKTEKTNTVGEPTSTTTTVTVSKSIADPAQAKGMFENNKATFVQGFADTLINSIVSSINDVKSTEGFSKFTSITIKPVASTNVIPTSSFPNGNVGLAQARMDALVNQIITPALAKMPDVKPLAQVDSKSGLAPNNSNEADYPGSSKWDGVDVNAEKYAEFRYSTVHIEVTYETTITSTTPGQTIEDVEYSGIWRISVMFVKPTGDGGGGGQKQKRIPRSFLNRQSPDKVGPCKRDCAAYN